MKTRQPNILYIMCDQFRADIMGCAGGPAKTPNLDALAAQGVRYSDCSTVSPLCVPARVNMMLGRYPHDTNVWNNAECMMSPEAPMWPKAILKAGYATCLIGKSHLHTDLGDMVAREYLVHRYGFEHVNEVSGPHSTCQTRTHLSDLWKEKGLFQAYCDDMKKREGEVTGAWASPLPLNDYYDCYVGRMAKEYLESYDQDKPWFCHVSFSGPHEPWDAPAPYDAMYDPADMPASAPRFRDACPQRPNGYLDQLFTKKGSVCRDETLARELKANYCGKVSLIDKLIGDLLETVRQRGQWDDTVIVFTSDHGEMNGDHGIVKKRNFLRQSLNIPLIIRTPATMSTGGWSSDALVNLLDVGPTLVEAAGGRVDWTQFGHSLLGHAEKRAQEPRTCILSELQGERMYLDGTWKMVVNALGESYLLFNVEDDPMEQLNVAGCPEYREVENRLKVRLLEEICRTTAVKPQISLAPIPKESVAGYERCTGKP